jgi:hypothetical protein
MCNDAKQMVWQALMAIRRDDAETLSTAVDNLRIRWLAALAAYDDDERDELGRWIPALTDELIRLRAGRRGVVWN